MKIAVAVDHGGFEYKAELISILNKMGHTVLDFGTCSSESVDYPDYGLKACLAVKNGECDRGILICGTGIGMSIVANKVKGIRCALVSDHFSAKATREHNDTNVMAMGARVIGKGAMADFVKVWLETEFIGSYHTKRIEKITEIENMSL